MFRYISRIINRTRSFHTTSAMARKDGVSEPEELKSFVERAGEKILVIDVRNPDASAEPGDQKSIAIAALPSEAFRPNAVNLIYDRATGSMPLPDVEKDSFIITHCGTDSVTALSSLILFHFKFGFSGGGGRGQLAKDYLMENGFTNVLNGGGPKESDCWAEYGEK